MKYTGSKIFVECLKEQGVDIIFGYPGGKVIFLYDELNNNTDSIKQIVTTHEQGAAHAADGYARSTGKIGVCIATSGPGATNLVTGIATAYMDSVPMVAFTGQVGKKDLGKDSFQEIDITGITIPITKHNYIVKEVSELANTIREAFAIAGEGRPGPVLVDICVNASVDECEYEPMDVSKGNFLKKHAGIRHDRVSDEDIEKAAAAINEAKKPYIITGGGVIISKTNELLTEIARKGRIPVATTLMGLGGFPSNDGLCTGLIGMHGSKTSNLAATHCDLLIAVGARFSDRVTSSIKNFAPNAKVMHIDIDPAEIGKNIPVDYPLCGYMDDILERLLEKLDKKKESEWVDKINVWRAKFPLSYLDDGKAVKPQTVVKKLYKHTEGNAIIVTEVGQNQIWAAQWYKFTQPRTYLSSGGLGTMGYGLGAAIGAQLANPDKKVINVAGDGSFRMNMQELATAVTYKLPIVIAILNNNTRGMVRQWQTLFLNKRYAATTIDDCVDYVALAEAFGAIGIRVDDPADVDDVIQRALSETKRPVVIDFRIDKDDNVYPIVPPGAAIKDVITEI